MKESYKTIVISDIHLGTQGSKAKEVTKFLKGCSCENLILNGDIIDGWRLKKGSKWKKKHTRFFNQVLKMTESDNTKVTYIRGNHDDFLDHILPFQIGNIRIVRDMIYESFGKKYYVVHGDIFDSITSNMKWIAKLGDIGYTFLLWLNHIYNLYRTRRGLPYYSFSQKVKSKVKSAVGHIDNYERQLVTLAKAKKYDAVICGHIHQPAIKEINGLLYLNSGDWVESMTALTESHHGDWSIVCYNESLASQWEKSDSDTIEEDEAVESFSMDQLVVQALGSKEKVRKSA